MLAARTGLHFVTVPIAPVCRGLPRRPSTSTASPRRTCRRGSAAVIWMAESNQHRPSIVLACGNKSELAVGYSTIYGDAVGGFAPIKDVPKTWVWRLARLAQRAGARARRDAADPAEDSITKEPSAELRPGQLDTDSLPAYAVLDDDPGRLRRRRQGPRRRSWRRASTRTLVDRVMRMVDRAEYKRRQYPPGTKITLQGLRPRPAAADHQRLARRSLK